jgi:hypothetical protein
MFSKLMNTPFQRNYLPTEFQNYLIGIYFSEYIKQFTKEL